MNYITRERNARSTALEFAMLRAIAACLLLSAMCVLSGAPPTAENSDKAIERSIRERLARSKLAADSVSFTVKDGTVSWEGSVSNPQRKGAATRMAHLAGARTVHNNLHVTKTGAPPRTARVEHD
jgi:hypothetical protein